ncbi:MAG: ADP-ribosylglycohydrolase family protein [Bacteroidales bacterium]|nr:ADP-ribosylglycohydrolase family protein [Bacteroidales bacterium]
MNEQRKYSGLIFSTSYLDRADQEQLAQLSDYVSRHDIKVAIVTNYHTDSARKWMKTAPIRVDAWVCASSIKQSRHTWYKKPMPQVMSVAMGKIGRVRSEVLSVCSNDTDRKASEAAFIDQIMHPAPSELIPLLTDAPKVEIPPVNLDVPAPLTGLFGAIVGDMVGVPHEHKSRTQNPEFKFRKEKWHCSDDSVLSAAVAQWLMGDRSIEDLDRQFTIWGYAHYTCGFGRAFKTWLDSREHIRRHATSNGAAMRVTPVGIVANSLEECLFLADMQARLTHNSNEASTGAQAVAVCVFLTRQGKSKAEIKKYIESTFGMNLDRSIGDLRAGYNIDEQHGSCDSLRCTSEAIICWLHSDTFEQTIRNAISLGGDADTIAAMAGGIAASTLGMEIPVEIAEECFRIMPEDLKRTLISFNKRYN